MCLRPRLNHKPPFTLSIIGTNDFHGHVERAAVFAGYMNNLRDAAKKRRDEVLLVDAGDMFQGTLESNLGEGDVVVEIYNALGYAAAAIGNHEFDFGPVGQDHVPMHTNQDPRGALKNELPRPTFLS